jgi:hypothetical protein
VPPQTLAQDEQQERTPKPLVLAGNQQPRRFAARTAGAVEMDEGAAAESRALDPSHPAEGSGLADTASAQKKGGRDAGPLARCCRRP